MNRTITSAPLTRTIQFTLDRAKVDDEKREFELSFSSEYPVTREFGVEILDHSPGACDLSRLNNGGAFCRDHNLTDQVGVVVSARIDPDRKGRAIVRMGTSPQAEQEFRDIKDGIRSNVSCSYRILEMAHEGETNGLSTYRVTKWEVLEISTVAVPADPSVGVGRSFESSKQSIQIMQNQNQQSEAERVKSIFHLADFLRSKVNIDKEARAAIENGTPFEDFQKRALELYPKGTVLATPNIGMDEGQRNSYSIVNAVRGFCERKTWDGPEAELSRHCERQYGFRAPGNALIIPHDALVHQRAQTATIASAGGFAVGTQTMTGSFIDYLRNSARVLELGAMQLEGLVGDVIVPKINGDVTAYWLTENGEVPSSEATFGQVAMTPHRVSASVEISNQLVQQTGGFAEQIVRQSIASVLGLALDKAAVAGTGVSGQPLGVLNAPGIQSVTFGGAATWAKIVAFETALSTANADKGSIAWLTTPAVRGKWKTAAKVTNYPSFLWQDGKVNDYRAEVTNQLPAGDKTILGNWADLMYGMWAGLQLVVDPFTQAKKNLVVLTATMNADIALRHGESFVVSTDSGAQ